LRFVVSKFYSASLLPLFSKGFSPLPSHSALLWISSTLVLLTASCVALGPYFSPGRAAARSSGVLTPLIFPRRDYYLKRLQSADFEFIKNIHILLSKIWPYNFAALEDFSPFHVYSPSPPLSHCLAFWHSIFSIHVSPSKIINKFHIKARLPIATSSRTVLRFHMSDPQPVSRKRGKNFALRAMGVRRHK